ncbi:MAG: PAS domain-containing sensor histidine kinase [Terriglobia bacterium]
MKGRFQTPRASSGRAKNTPETLDGLRARLVEMEETLRAIRCGEVDALLVSGPSGDRVFTLQGADHPYRVMVEAINEGAATVAPEGAILYANRRFAEMLDTPLEKLIGSDLHDFVRTAERPILDSLLTRAKETRQKEQLDLLIHDGRTVPVYLSLSPLRESEFEGICAIATDLSEQKHRERELAQANKTLEAEIAERGRVEQALRESEKRFDSFMENSPAIAFIKDEDGRYLFCNKRFERIYGIPAQNLLGKTDFDWLPKEWADSLREHDLTVLSQGAPLEIVESIPGRDQTPHEWLVLKFPFRDRSGRRLVGGVAVEVTDQKRAEESLRRLSGRLLRLQDEERRRIAQELHDSTAQTLTALSLNLALIHQRGRTQNDAQTSNLLTECQTLADQAAREVRNLSHLLHPPDLDRIGLAAAIRWHVQRFREISGIAVDLDLQSGLGRLPEDIEIALFRIVQESLTNVQRHSQSPLAKVRLTRLDNEIVLIVEDEGCGAPAELLKQLDKDGARLGLGVAGMEERVRQLGGRLSITPGNPGTIVEASVPL